jgi:hypothetical protein
VPFKAAQKYQEALLNKNSESVISFESLPFGGKKKHKRAAANNNVQSFRERIDQQQSPLLT